jgi:hypothetical protein
MYEHVATELSQMRTIEDIKFYHGTSRIAVAGLLDGESVSWFYEDARALAGDIVSVLLRHRSNLLETADLFVDSGAENSISAPLGLGQLVDGNPASSFSYGQLWLTSSFKMASEYALRNRHGSEAFAFLMDGLTVLDFIGERDDSELLRKYPRLHRLSSMHHEPVVISFCGLSCGDLQGQHGGIVTPSDVFGMLHSTSGVEYSPSYRLLSVQPEKIVGIHDLADCLRTTTGHTVLPFPQDFPEMDPASWLTANMT